MRPFPLLRKKKRSSASEVELRQDITGLLAARLSLRRSTRGGDASPSAALFLEKLEASDLNTRDGLHRPLKTALRRTSRVSMRSRQVLPVTRIAYRDGIVAMFRRSGIPKSKGRGYQQGDQLGLEMRREYVLFRTGHVLPTLSRLFEGQNTRTCTTSKALPNRRRCAQQPDYASAQACHKACHAGKISLLVKRVLNCSGRKPSWASCVWTLLDRMRKAHSGLPVENTYGYLTKKTAITLGTPQNVSRRCILHRGNPHTKRRLPPSATGAQAQPLRFTSVRCYRRRLRTARRSDTESSIKHRIWSRASGSSTR